jgi:pilus assembly protein Flp/PilA
MAIFKKKGDTNMFLSKQEKGQGLIEYALIIVLVSIVVIVVLALLGPAISNIFQQIINTI